MFWCLTPLLRPFYQLPFVLFYFRQKEKLLIHHTVKCGGSMPQAMTWSRGSQTSSRPSIFASYFCFPWCWFHWRRLCTPASGSPQLRSQGVLLSLPLEEIELLFQRKLLPAKVIISHGLWTCEFTSSFKCIYNPQNQCQALSPCFPSHLYTCVEMKILSHPWGLHSMGGIEG